MSAIATPWIPLAVASGACAAFNGVFAKLTTTELTTSIASAVAGGFGLNRDSKAVEYIVRGVFFVLNLVFNGIMWALFTASLARSPSATRVSIINTSANFMLTALMGWTIFSESLPPLWFLGAALLVGGSVIIGKRGEGEGDSPTQTGEGRASTGSEGGSRERYVENDREDVGPEEALLVPVIGGADVLELRDEVGVDGRATKGEVKSPGEEDDPLK
ncbi:MAG: hypothetical protein M4579_005453 [Chaenotheca gracillima]|nr:MAG: hypothetical protein M4579_005453 [Chaenotheca gracillima]